MLLTKLTAYHSIRIQKLESRSKGKYSLYTKQNKIENKNKSLSYKKPELLVLYDLQCNHSISF